MAFDQQQLEKEGIYEAKCPLPDLFTDLDQISQMAAIQAAKRKEKAKTGGYIILAGVIGCIAGAVAGLSWLLILSILAFICGLFYWINSFFGGGKLIAHRTRVDVAMRRIEMLQQDSSFKAPYSLRLALTSNPRTLSDGKWSGRKNGKQLLLEDCWLSLQGPLLDGTVVTDEIKELTRKRTFSTARGKTKSKSRITHVVDIRFSYPKQLYGDARAAEKALHGEVKVSSAAALRAVRVTEKAVAMKAVVKVEDQILPTAGMLSVGAYRILNLARTMAAGQRGNAQ